MKKPRLRITAAFLLLFTFLAFSGMTSTAIALAQPAATSGCCDFGCGDTPFDSAPTSPDCPCFSCISMMMGAPVLPKRAASSGVLVAPSAKRSNPSDYIPSIEYPPETV